MIETKTNKRVNLNPHKEVFGIDLAFWAKYRNKRYGNRDNTKKGLGSIADIPGKRIEASKIML